MTCAWAMDQMCSPVCCEPHISFLGWFETEQECKEAVYAAYSNMKKEDVDESFEVFRLENPKTAKEGCVYLIYQMLLLA